MQRKSKSNAFKDNFQELLNFVSDSIVVFNQEGVVLAANKTASILFGLAVEELIGNHIEDLKIIDEKTKIFVKNQLQKRIKGKEIENYDIPVLVNGETRYFEPKGNRIDYFGEPAILIILRDITEKRQIQGQLLVKIAKMDEQCQESEEKYRKLFQESKDAMILVNEKAKVTCWNPAAEKTFGYRSEEAIGKDIHKLVVPNTICKEGKERISSSVKVFTETGMGYFTVGNVELAGRRKDGTEFPAELSISPIKLCGKWNAAGVVKDVTDRKKAEQKLREAEQRYHALFNEAPLGVLVIDSQTEKPVEFNDIAHTQLGYSREEFSKLRISDFEAKETADEISTHVARMVREGGGEFETKQRTKNGEIRDVLVTTRAVELAGKPFLHCIFHDITEIRKVQDALMKSESQYRQLVNVAQEGIWAMDSNYRTVFVNPRMAEMLGYAESEIVGKSLFDFLFKADVEQATQSLSQFKQGMKGNFEYELIRKDGSRVNTSIAAAQIRDDEGSFLGTLALVADITLRKKMENELRQETEKLETITESIGVGLTITSKDYRILWTNKVMKRIRGIPDLVGRTCYATYNYLDTVCPECGVKKVFEGKEFDSREYTVFDREKGSTVWIQLIATPIKDKDGNVTSALELVLPITERKMMEQSLKDSEERFRAISTSAMDAIILVDGEDKVIYWNPAAERTFGFAEKEVVNKKLAELVIPLHGRKNHAALLEELKHNSFSKEHFEFTALRKDGTEFPMELSVASVKLKDKNCLLSIVRDVSERKAMEEALRQERDKLESITKNIGAGLVTISKDYKILWLNNYLKQFTGASENNPCYSSFNTCTTICPDCGPKKIFEGAPFDTREYCNKTEYNKDHPVWFELIATPIKDKDGNVVAALELTVNITEKKNLEAKLAEYSQKLEKLVEERTKQLQQTQAKLVKSERLAAIGELAGMVGHDLRNPLTGIKNSSYYLKKKGAEISEAQAKEMLETIDKCVDYSNKIVSDLLDYSKEIRLELQECSLRKLLAEALAMMNMPEKVEILNHLPDELHLKVDSDKIKRVFINLIKNAVDAMPNGGKITIDSKEVNGSLEISFADIGIGISDEVLPKLFAPLFTTKAQGMGFGLAICKRLIEAHGGTITVKIAKGKGTTFTVTLPIEPKLEIGGEKIWINMPKSSLSMMTKT